MYMPLSLCLAVGFSFALFHTHQATSSLDAVAESKVQKALEQLLQGRTCITIAHRLSTVRSADTIVVLHEGRILEKVISFKNKNSLPLAHTHNLSLLILNPMRDASTVSLSLSL